MSVFVGTELRVCATVCHLQQRNPQHGRAPAEGAPQRQVKGRQAGAAARSHEPQLGRLASLQSLHLQVEFQ